MTEVSRIFIQIQYSRAEVSRLPVEYRRPGTGGLPYWSDSALLRLVA